MRDFARPSFPFPFSHLSNGPWACRKFCLSHGSRNLISRQFISYFSMSKLGGYFDRSCLTNGNVKCFDNVNDWRLVQLGSQRRGMGIVCNLLIRQRRSILCSRTHCTDVNKWCKQTCKQQSNCITVSMWCMEVHLPTYCLYSQCTVWSRNQGQ